MKTTQKFRQVLTGYVETGRFEASRLKAYDKPSAISRLWNRAA
jgi:hypothetical protein